MNRPILHRALYLDEIDRSLRLHAELETDALLARVRQNDTSGCSDHDADETNDARWELVIALLVVFVGFPFAAWLYRLTDVQVFLHFLRMQP